MIFFCSNWMCVCSDLPLIVEERHVNTSGNQDDGPVSEEYDVFREYEPPDIKCHVSISGGNYRLIEC